MNFIFSPFVIPVAGCLVAIVAIVSGIWLDGHKRRMKSEERIAMIARGVPLAEIEKMLGAGDEERPPVKDPLRSLGNARRAGIVASLLTTTCRSASCRASGWRWERSRREAHWIDSGPSRVGEALRSRSESCTLAS